MPTQVLLVEAVFFAPICMTWCCCLHRSLPANQADMKMYTCPAGWAYGELPELPMEALLPLLSVNPTAASLWPSHSSLLQGLLRTNMSRSRELLLAQQKTCWSTWETTNVPYLLSVFRVLQRWHYHLGGYSCSPPLLLKGLCNGSLRALSRRWQRLMSASCSKETCNGSCVKKCQLVWLEE